MTNNSVLVSIVITTHKRGDLLKSAMESAINQTYKNIEIIVVDDNNDFPLERKKTEEVLKNYKKIRLIENVKNMGGAASRNIGVAAAKGELISFLDDDDQYLPDRVERLYKIFDDHRNENVGLVYCSCSAIDESGKVIGEYVNSASGSPFYQHMLGCVAGTSMWLIPKSIFETLGGFDDIDSDEDSLMLLRILIAGYNIFGTPEKLVLYLEHKGPRLSGVSLSNAKGMNAYRMVCRKQYYRLSKKQIADIETNFSRRLITIYLINSRPYDAKKELLNIRKYKPFSRIYYKNAIKILFSKWYIERILRKQG